MPAGKRKKKPVPRHTNAPRDTFELASYYAKQFVKAVEAGHYDSEPDFKAFLDRRLKQHGPDAVDPGFGAIESILRLKHAGQDIAAVAAEVKLTPIMSRFASALHTNDDGDKGSERLQISVVVAPWASSKQQIEPPRSAIEIDYVATDRELDDSAPCNSRPEPKPSADNDIVAVNPWGAQISRKRFEELKAMGVDTSKFTLVGEIERQAAARQADFRPLSNADERRQTAERNAANSAKVVVNSNLFE